jgi:hypothetical protein
MGAMDDLEWLNTNPDLHALTGRYPDIWLEAGKALAAAAESGRADAMNELASKAKWNAEVWKARITKSRNNSKVIESAVRAVVKSRMIILSLERAHLAAAAGKTTGTVRFTLLNGNIIQRLLFAHDLVRKPASLRAFRFWWPLMTQKAILMPLVQDKGIYCFYTRELIAELCAMIGDRPCLEVGAGDGTLARFLREKGVRVTATDDQSWKHAIEYPAEVENLDARRALARYQPAVVICSWPPPGNGFESQVFATPSVELYIMIGSRNRMACGNWDEYAKQQKFELVDDQQLGGLLLPPDDKNAVVLFRRKPAAVCLATRA